ncbi:MAG TPA: zf-HC2 domain-containing protein [Acidimicrobiales bacterium]|nr:zf-HC2 domain-containing protein [Acidimicrobiales bacterium]
MSAAEASHLDDALSALLDGELSAEEEALARTHLAACAACAGELEGLRSVRSVVRGLPPEPPPFGFLDRLSRPHHPTGRRRRRRVGLAALAATATASFGVLLLSSPADAPVSPQMVRLVEAHATSASGDPISQLAPVGVPITFRR